MPRCRICDRENPPGAQRCTECGAWLDVPATSQVDEAFRPPAETPRAASPPPAEMLEPANPTEADVVRLVRQKRYIEAIKAYRSATGGGLKESKDAVDEICRRHGIERPKSGCTVSVGTSMIVFALLAWTVWKIVVV